MVNDDLFVKDLVVVEPVVCIKCGCLDTPHPKNPKMCVPCVKAEQNRLSYKRRRNENWIQVAEEADLMLWERQPEETDMEYQIWLKYRDMYPSKKPSYRVVADDLQMSIESVQKTASRWHFPVRIQAWAKYVDELTLTNRRKEIIDMNAKHVSMAQKLNEKLEVAIDNLDPTYMKPNEIVNMMKMATELERKALLDPTEINKPSVGDDNPILKKSPTQLDDMAEILSILQNSGALENAAAAGIKKTVTTTTEVIVKGD